MRKLTKKQEEFSRMVGDGRGQVEAYREVYETSGTPNGQRVDAHRLSNRPNVALAIEERRASNARLAAQSARSRSAWIVERLFAESEDQESPAAARIRALEILGKASGLFDSEGDRESKRKTATESELASELTARLQDLLPGLGVIDTDRIVSEVEESDDDDPPTPL